MKRMMLVPESLIDSLRRKDEIKSTPQLDAAVQLGKEMDELRQRKDLDVAEKSMRYQEVLRQYLHFLGEVRDETKLPSAIVPVSADVSKPLPSEKFSEITQSLPRTAQERAQKLLNYTAGSLGWDPQTKEALINGNKISGSNISDLLYDTVVYHKRKDAPSGWQEFAQFLESNNVPHHLRTNRRVISNRSSNQRGGATKQLEVKRGRKRGGCKDSIRTTWLSL